MLVLDSSNDAHIDAIVGRSLQRGPHTAGRARGDGKERRPFGLVYDSPPFHSFKASSLHVTHSLIHRPDSVIRSTSKACHNEFTSSNQSPV